MMGSTLRWAPGALDECLRFYPLGMCLPMSQQCGAHLTACCETRTLVFETATLHKKTGAAAPVSVSRDREKKRIKPLSPALFPQSRVHRAISPSTPPIPAPHAPSRAKPAYTGAIAPACEQGVQPPEGSLRRALRPVRPRTRTRNHLQRGIAPDSHRR